MIRPVIKVGMSSCLFLLVGATFARALTLETIIAELNAQPVVDTFDVKMTTKVAVGGQLVSVRSHIISKGPEKMWMEQQTPAGTQRIIRNGQLAQSIDLRTGQKQTLNTRDLEGMHGSMNRQVSLFAEGRYAAPRNIGSKRYELDMVPGSDSTILSRRVVYDASQKAVVKVSQVGARGDTTITEMVQGVAQGRRVLTAMRIEVRLEGMATRMDMDYTDYAFPATILDGLFTIKE